MKVSMMKIFLKDSKKSEKGQVLVLVGLIIIVLVALVGLAIDTGYLYVSYARLRRGVDAAALAGSAEFIRPANGLWQTRDAYILAATKQMLDLNGVHAKDPIADNIKIQTCDSTPGDLELCKAPLKKIIRVRVTEDVPLFFLPVIPGMPRSVPITVDSLAEASSVDVMLVIDTSESMAFDSGVGNDLDPKVCNDLNSCHPFIEVRDGAKAFVDYPSLYYPYDRVGLVHFDQHGDVILPFSDDPTTIHAAIDSMKVFEGVSSPIHDPYDSSHTQSGTKCLYFSQYTNIDPAAPGGPWTSYPYGYNSDAPNWKPDEPWNDVQLPPQLVPGPFPAEPITYTSDPYGPCRLYSTDSDTSPAPMIATGNTYVGRLSCPMRYGPNVPGTSPDPSRCGSTNIAEGLSQAGRAFLGQYDHNAAYYGLATLPTKRDDTVWVLVMLGDGAADAAYKDDGDPICPVYTWDAGYPGGYAGTPCRDTGSGSTSNTIVSTGPGRHASSNTPWYDADDAARDNADIVATNNIYMYTIGLGNLVGTDSTKPGYALLNYLADKGGGKYFAAASTADLIPAFQTIAGLIVSRINQ